MDLSSGFYGPLLVERAAFAVQNELLSPEIKSSWCNAAFKYLRLLQSNESPHLGIISSFVDGNQDTSVPDSATPKLQINYNVSRKAVAHQYSDAIALQEADSSISFLEKLHGIIKLLIMSEKWKSLDEMDHRLDAYMKSKEDYLSEPEKHTTSSIRILICGALFLQGRYFDCLKYFVMVIQKDPGVFDILLLSGSEVFFTNEEIITMITLSVIVSVPLDNYEEFAQLEELKPFFVIAPALSNCLSLLIDTSYNSFLKLWTESFGQKCASSYFLCGRWKEVQATMRYKIYFFYLRISNRVEISYLSETLGIDVETVRAEINSLIEDLTLNFSINDQLVYYRNRYEMSDVVKELSSSKVILDERIEKLKNQNDLVRYQVQQSIIENNARLRERSETLDTCNDEFNENLQNFVSNSEPDLGD
ncbi:LAQU0S09e01552g1_1 [Lachancea quebecensis]|uniref:LAQU0S09e01552g1_1 n=1 Tax=Lachancea quebecensis TaxID=1654605 RepID=A0A0P1KTW3_9SACH|nr:LAQU0S09e01552g1_1 [Lachancea quebecensis]